MQPLPASSYNRNRTGNASRFLDFYLLFSRCLNMPAEKATALVLRTTDWSETSRIATLWTREFGKVRVLAKGGRRLKSAFENALDLLTLCSIVLLRKSSGGLHLLTEAPVGQRDRVPLSDAALEYLRALAAAGEGWRRVGEQADGDVRRLLGQYVTWLRGRRPRMLAYLEATVREADRGS